MLTKKLSIASLIFCAQVSTISAQPVVAEPSLFDIGIGKPLAVPDCAYENMGGYAFVSSLARISVTCVEPLGKLASFDRSNAKFRVHMPGPWPEFMNRNTFEIETKDGIVRDIFVLTTGIPSQQLVLNQLKEKFGMPPELTSEGAGTLAGATFDVVHAVWHFSNGYVIRFTGASRQATVGIIHGEPEFAASNDNEPGSPKL